MPTQNLPWGRDYRAWTTPQLQEALKDCDPEFFPLTRQSINAELQRRSA